MGRLRLTQGDTRPPLYIHLTKADGSVLDVSTAQAVYLKFRAAGSDTILTQITGVLLPGTLEADGVTVDETVYPTAGSGGRVRFDFPEGSLDVSPGFYEGEVEIVYSATLIQSPYDRLQFVLREDV